MRALQLRQKTRRKDFRELALLHAIAANPLYSFGARSSIAEAGLCCTWPLECIWFELPLGLLEGNLRLDA